MISCFTLNLSRGMKIQKHGRIGTRITSLTPGVNSLIIHIIHHIVHKLEETKSMEKNKYNKGGEICNMEPKGTYFLNSNPMYKDCFQQGGCLAFCEKFQGYNIQVAEQFALNFEGNKTRIEPLEF